ncbi:hypothetical protein [Nocardia sp. CC227C]|uniref:hypothetical protein n=1 Tax=Nocardia sp. CC227C TaxID=3044562 RepID=UPI00278C12DD|nr:hypothetical protein [Nocardia sp. CC227C]
MTFLLLPFLFGIGLGVMTTWIITSLTTTHPAHLAGHDTWSVHSIAARIARERLQAETGHPRTPTHRVTPRVRGR